MENKKLYIGLGILAVAGLGIYLYRKNKSENSTEEKASIAGLGFARIRQNPRASQSNAGGSVKPFIRVIKQAPRGADLS